MKKWIAGFPFLMLAFLFSANAQDKLETGKNLLKSGKAKEAVVVLKTVNPADLKYTDAMVELAKAYLAVGKPDSAEISAKIALDKNDKNPEVYIILSRAYIEQKKKPEVYAILKKGLKSVKNNPALLTQLGYTHLLHDSTDLAIVDFSRAKEVDPKFALAYEGLGDVYSKLQGDAIATMQYEEAVKLDSTKEELLYKLAKVLMKERRYTEAARAYNMILKLKPDNESVRLELGKLYFAAKQYVNAARIFAPFVEKNLKDEAIWKTFLEAIDSSKRYDLGYSVAENILKTQPKSPKAIRLAGKSGYYTRKYSESIKHYEALGKIETLSGEDLKYFGRSNYEMKKDSLAIKYMEQSLAVDSTQSDIFVDLGNTYMRQKRWDKAAAMFEKKMNQDSSYVTAFVNYALCIQQPPLEKFEQARNALLKALRQRPNYLNGHYYLANCYAQLKSVPDAKREYETVIVLADTMKSKYKTELGDAYKYIGVTLLSENNYPSAMEALNSALVYRPKDMQLMVWKAQTLHAMNRKDEARKEFEKILKMDPNNKDAKRGLDILDLY